MRRPGWTDARLDEKMGAIDSTFDMLRDEIRGFREDTREELRGLREDNREELRGLREDNRQQFSALHSDMRDLRGDFASLQGRLVQIGFGMVGVLIASMVALILAVA